MAIQWPRLRQDAGPAALTPDGLPGLAERPDGTEGAADALRLASPEAEQRIGQREIAKAAEILKNYKNGKKVLEQRIVDDELWWELRHWEAIRRGKRFPKDRPPDPEPSSAWLFNAILNKHADAMDNYPEAIVLPRERSDTETAKLLSSVVPVLMEYNEYEQTYSDSWWEKLKHGTAAYGVFWNPEKENGLGDVDIRPVDLLKIFWEPGITDIQASRNLFITELADEDLLERQYPQFKGRLGGGVIDIARYQYDDEVDTSKKSVVVDWYYKTRAPGGRTVLHYCKFVNDCVLYASENDPAYRDTGWYEDGAYPVVMDCLFPEKGTPVGFGYVAICKDPQLYIDRLSANILENALMASKRRYFVSRSTGINRDQFLDWNDPLVDVEGEVNDTRIKEIKVNPLDAIYVSVANMKIDEMKDTAANRDVNAGSAASGVTAAAAIAALQEAGNKASRDMIKASYRSHTAVVRLVIERIRQFYDERRTFRITGQDGSYAFREISNAGLRDQQTGVNAMGAPLLRRPVFDLKIKAQRQNPFSRMEQNATAKELYGMGFFNPETAQQSLIALDMMDFEGIEEIREKVRQGQTLMNMLQQTMQLLRQIAAGPPGAEGPPPEAGAAPGPGPEPGQAQGEAVPVDTGTAGEVMASRQARTPYMQRLADGSRPEV